MQPADDGAAARADRSRQIRRYGPLAAIVVLLVVVAAVVAIGGGDDGRDGDGDGGSSESAGATGDLDWSEIGDAEPGAPEPVGDMPVTYAEANEAGDVDDLEWPDTCDTDRGTVKLPSVYAPPCVPTFDGDNGGATATGVTGDTIKVVYYVPQPGADLDALLVSMGVNDTPDERVETFEQYIEIYSAVAQTYGRQVEVVKFEASGTDVTASRADAIDVIAMDPFAVINGPGLDRGTFAQELADAGVLCFGCGGVLPDSMVLDMAPYSWASLPTPDQFLGMLDAWVRAGQEASPDALNTANYAGGDLEGAPRKVGVIHFEQDPPIFADTGQAQEERFEQVEIIETYLFDLATLPTKANELMAEFKSEGITSIVFLGDPIMPGYLTEAATELDYFPEWIFTGTALTDTNVMGRQWDPAQMEHAYGMSQLAAPAEQDLQGPITLYRWYFGGDDDSLPPARNQYALQAAPAGWLVAGIHMAGPELTAETFARGLFRIPPAGGGPANPQVSYGNWGVFPAMDYQGVDDAVEIWWDPTVEAEDERGEVGPGVWRRSNGAERFTIEEAPPPKPFTDEEHTVTVLEELSEEDTPPDYPPPAGSPAAG